jgi:hypothetical protein
MNGVIGFANYDHHCAADLLEYFHDYRVVRSPAVPAGAVAYGDSGELDDRIPGILLSGAGEPDRVWGIYGVSIEGNSGGDHTLRVRSVCMGVPRRTREVESRGVVFVFGWGGGVCVLGEVVEAQQIEPDVPHLSSCLRLMAKFIH